MQRCEIWWASLPPPMKSGPGYRRPVVVMQSDDFNGQIREMGIAVETRVHRRSTIDNLRFGHVRVVLHGLDLWHFDLGHHVSPSVNCSANERPLCCRGRAKGHPGNPTRAFNNLRKSAVLAVRIFPVSVEYVPVRVENCTKNEQVRTDDLADRTHDRTDRTHDRTDRTHDRTDRLHDRSGRLSFGLILSTICRKVRTIGPAARAICLIVCAIRLIVCTIRPMV